MAWEEIYHKMNNFKNKANMKLTKNVFEFD